MVALFVLAVPAALIATIAFAASPEYGARLEDASLTPAHV